MAGSPCPIEVMRRAVDRMHLREITICYGMTETSPVSFQTTADDPLERRVTTVGRIHPHLEVKIVDAEGRIVPRGVTGELCTRGYSVMLGYWDDPPRTEQVIDAARWMHTGDLAVIDEEGYCNIVGRIKDVVIRGGENVYPARGGGVPLQPPRHPGRAVLRRARRALRRGALRLGEAPPRRRAGARRMCGPIAAAGSRTRRCRATCDSSTSFPMTVTGKMQKYLMRETMERELGVVADATA